MSHEDRTRWDNRYADKGPATATGTFPQPLFSSHADHFPPRGLALELACGSGATAVCFAQRGMTVHGVDVSAVAIDQARHLATNQGVDDNCRFDVFDLDNGLPESPLVDLLVCQNFRNPDLYVDMQSRLAPNGLLAIVILSEVDASPGRFRAQPGELVTAFAEMNTLCAGEADGRAWLLARKQSSD